MSLKYNGQFKYWQSERGLARRAAMRRPSGGSTLLPTMTKKQKVLYEYLRHHGINRAQALTEALKADVTGLHTEDLGKQP